MKAAYFGIDALQNCLELLHDRGIEIAAIFTIEGGEYDSSQAIRGFASSHDIPLKTSRVTSADIRALEEEGVELSVTAGYPWFIPLSKTIRQVNIHPSCLPLGRGAWPMPVSILRDLPSGVTLHKLSERFDEGDIILKREIPLGEDENLETLFAKIRTGAGELLGQFLDEPDRLWEGASAQEGGEYWPEPTDEDRRVSTADDAGRVRRILRAFYGYGILIDHRGVTLEVRRGRVVSGETGAAGLRIPLSDGVLIAEDWRPYFRGIELSDRERVEAIRLKYGADLSSFTFALLFCWQEQLGLSIYIGEDIFVMRGEGYYFCPIGEPGRVMEFISLLLELDAAVTLRFCDERRARLLRDFPGEVSARLCEDDCDYIIENKALFDLAGGQRQKRRNDYNHYCNSTPPPLVEEINEGNLHHAEALSEECSGEDHIAEKRAIRNFKALGLRGVLVKRGERYMGFALASEMRKDVLQGHFSKSADEERGGYTFVIRACSVAVMERYRYTNLEDDMGHEGLRYFKQSLNADVVPSYTLRIDRKK